MLLSARPACVFFLTLSLAMLGCENGGDGSGSSGGTGGSAGSGATGGRPGPTDLEVQPLMYMLPELPVELLEEGDLLELWRAPQGGHVVLIGARVRGLESDFIELIARIRVPETRIIVAEAKQTVVMEDVQGELGLKQTDRRSRSQTAHVALCPDFGERDVVDQAHLLEVIVTELYADFSVGHAEITVVPTCMQSDPAANALCVCECTANYIHGRCGPLRDAGVDGTSDAASPVD